MSNLTSQIKLSLLKEQKFGILEFFANSKTHMGTKLGFFFLIEKIWRDSWQLMWQEKSNFYYLVWHIRFFYQIDNGKD